MHRILEPEDNESRTWHWHPTAGKVYWYEPTVHNHWKALFLEGKEGNPDAGYHPFQSRLDWEIAQWAIKEKIMQHSLDCLLQIPQVSPVP
ncbi:hypothetical protein GYMLUDRAFT_160546 [Collybiopsis luxurians FD-317 M1]|nr:hypothetical protein GYMLUDRAFT_160546 [Collybiopsis luxurians FD-317 M1]